MLRTIISSAALLAVAGAIPVMDKAATSLMVTAPAEVLVHEAAHYKQAFAKYKEDFGKAYVSEAAEEEALAHFVANDRIIETHNAKGASFELGHNFYSDMSWEQFSALHLSGLEERPPRQERVMVRTSKVGEDDGLPEDVDWVKQGCVTPIKDQGACGSCWAFSAIGAIEGAYCVASGNLVSLSEQELVSCDGSEYGCGGGLMDNAFRFVEENGVCTEEDDPYSSGTGRAPKCTPEQRRCQPAVTITGLQDVPAKDEAALKAAVAQQPVSVAIEADRSVFQLYKSGVFTSVTCGTQLDHGVLAVGYGHDEASGLDYWKVKNSWGPKWGEEGYIRIQRGQDLCGIAMQASYPTGAKAVPKPGPEPPSPPPPAPKTHYGDPKTGCLDSELAVQVQGAEGDFCSSKCVPLFKPCPKDKPAGVMAMPMCALTDQAHGVSYCALICAGVGEPIDEKANGMCGPTMSCQPLQGGVGICTYPL